MLDLSGGITSVFTLIYRYVDKINKIQIEGWNRVAELSERHLRKGSPVIITGRLATDVYAGRERDSRHCTRIVMYNLFLKKENIG